MEPQINPDAGKESAVAKAEQAAIEAARWYLRDYNSSVSGYGRYSLGDGFVDTEKLAVGPSSQALNKAVSEYARLAGQSFEVCRQQMLDAAKKAPGRW